MLLISSLPLNVEHPPNLGHHIQTALPLLCKHQATGEVIDLFEKLPWKEDAQSWPEANLRDAMFYLRRSKLLALPFQYKCLIPRNLEEAQLLESH